MLKFWIFREFFFWLFYDVSIIFIGFCSTIKHSYQLWNGSFCQSRLYFTSFIFFECRIGCLIKLTMIFNTHRIYIVCKESISISAFTTSHPSADNVLIWYFCMIWLSHISRLGLFCSAFWYKSHCISDHICMRCNIIICWSIVILPQLSINFSLRDGLMMILSKIIVEISEFMRILNKILYDLDAFLSN